MKIQTNLPKEVIFSSTTENLPKLEDGYYGRKIYTQTVMVDPMQEREEEVLKNFDILVEEKAFGKNAPYTIKKKGFDKYSYDTGETRRNLKVKINMEKKEY